MNLELVPVLVGCLLFLIGNHQGLAEPDLDTGSYHQNHLHNHGTIDTVTLTQRGYLQFLRYIVDVPPLLEYTFCIWVKSSNLTYSHPLLSYSKNEEDRLIRVWISPHGSDINLEILEVPIFKYPVFLKEHNWYHVCQSWSAYHGAWSLFLNGKLAANGFESKLAGRAIRGGGDVVVGQEYTDFDKGLEDGIEGEIYGFNFVLSSATVSAVPNSLATLDYNRRQTQPYPTRFHHNQPQVWRRSGDSRNLSNKNRMYLPAAANNYPTKNTRRAIPATTNPALKPKTRKPRGIILDALHNMISFFKGPNHNYKPPMKTIDEFNREQDRKYHEMAKTGRHPGMDPPAHQPQVHPVNSGAQARVINDFHYPHVHERPFDYVHERPMGHFGERPYNERPLGLALVEMGYNCILGKGAPLRGEKVLVSWTRTTVRVFGGAILKPMLPFCVQY